MVIFVTAISGSWMCACHLCRGRAWPRI